MAVSNKDRISSAGLLDVLKGLQNDGHLGKEPEVTEETIVYERVVVPAPGTYTGEDFTNAFAIPDESRLPFKVYTTVLTLSNTPITISEPSGEYIELPFFNGVAYTETETSANDFNNYTGYALYEDNGLWVVKRMENGLPVAEGFRQWEMPEKTETKTTVTKRTIDPKYLPNADWNENDPNAPGYIEGRTHWVENGINDITPTMGDGTYIVPSFGKVYGYSWDAYPSAGTEAGEWYPDFEPVSGNFNGLPMWYLAVDENGEQIVDFNFEEMQAANFIVCIDGSAYGMGGVLLATHEIKTVRMFVETVHKLDPKFYDQMTEDNVKSLLPNDNAVLSVETAIKIKPTAWRSNEFLAYLIEKYGTPEQVRMAITESNGSRQYVDVYNWNNIKVVNITYSNQQTGAYVNYPYTFAISTPLGAEIPYRFIEKQGFIINDSTGITVKKVIGYCKKGFDVICTNRTTDSKFCSSGILLSGYKNGDTLWKDASLLNEDCTLSKIILFESVPLPTAIAKPATLDIANDTIIPFAGSVATQTVGAIKYANWRDDNGELVEVMIVPKNTNITKQKLPGRPQWKVGTICPIDSSSDTRYGTIEFENDGFYFTCNNDTNGRQVFCTKDIQLTQLDTNAKIWTAGEYKAQ